MWPFMESKENSKHPQQHHHHHHQQQQQQMPYEILQSAAAAAAPSSSTQVNFMNKGTTGAYDLGDLDQALLLYLEGQDQQQSSSSGITPPTLNIFPSQPMHVDPPSKGGIVGSVAHANSVSKKPLEQPLELVRSDLPSVAEHGRDAKADVKRQGNARKGLTSSSEHEGPKTPDPKAYVQQLENSRIKLTQLEQELQRARAQGVFYGGGAILGDQGLQPSFNGISSDAAMFDMEYGRWLEEHHRLMCELRGAVQEHLQENQLRIYVDNCLAHYDEIMALKNMVLKSDVFHIVSGVWKSPAERCFMWIGGFRPSDLLKILLNHIEPLTEQQILGICGLQQSTQEAEDALSQGMEALNQSLSDTVASDALSCPSNMANYMSQMAIAMNKLSTLEGFVKQADNLRQQTLHRLHHILTVRQAARCFLAIAEYFHRLRALSSLWLARPRQEQ
ncbi:TGACG-sequence-specific DNA-binding protein TGA-2.1 [Acorus gramineus]|uniref:TGACG-sequence-specific DNA-binding protein TGA-2.1 n=1 Tax=Acorus gramineus TaxID=55184 RepID=A0AAV9A6R0_ACOGR|nr:TGACG-sequence-specific DNA-binding protein TGA-2.1 [Acorus gramineus]